ncbi:EAL domain-containing protein [Litchfieldia salsa]|uniref:EAL domain, c-di-GMP-specific phosphodiesterase class I (Or its enzymatically inactive variant) n=1 Tax=Litchfieldia salsa TaxID=930152 RepID=A0A1H0T8X0_9BACI|nr:EAL domain-containing protein [Litchfieldia salsa]SDP50140.1 EAL domain, c-di-GMP-specific phosphodiesterase class I (or its enzymatically inactive variant) [Litchfieldia salsa]
MQNTSYTSFLSNLSIFDLFSYLNHAQEKKMSHTNDFTKFIELKKIMRNRSLTTFFQPIFNLETNNIIGYEALNRPTSSNAFPTTENFYDYIGQTNQVFQFELFSRNLSFKQFHSEVKKSPQQKDHLLFVNIHPQVLVDSNYKSGETLELLEYYEISPKQVVFELTEKKAVTDFKMFERILSNYRDQGFRIAIDDAGSGYNSLKTLVHLKPEFIKFDRSLIHNISSNQAQQKMICLLVEFARESNTQVLAEGIEKIEDLNYLKDKQVHLGQGYSLGRPSQSFF